MITIDEFAEKLQASRIKERKEHPTNFYSFLMNGINQYGHLRMGNINYNPTSGKGNMSVHKNGIMLGLNGPPSPNDRYFLHDHSFFELAYVYRGKFHNVVQDEVTIYEQGDFILMAPSAVHATYVTNLSDYLFNLLLTEDQIMDIINIPLIKNGWIRKFVFGNYYNMRNVPDTLFFHTNDDPFVRNIMETIMLELINEQPNYLQAACCGTSMLFTVLERFLQNTENIFYQGNQQMDEIFLYIRKHFLTLTLSDLAEHFSYSTSYISHQIKKETGLTFSETILQLKLKQACVYLRDSTMRLYEIAEKCGFYDVSNFCKRFKSMYGITPSEYREKIC